MNPLVYRVIPPHDGPAEGAPVLVLLHGVGGNERNLLDLADHLDGRFALISIRAPLQIAPDGFAFFQVRFTPEPVIVPEQAEASRLALIEQLPRIVRENGFDPTRVVLVGFSQGAIIGASVALSRPDLVAGLVMFSGRVLPEVSPAFADREALSKLPVFVGHGVHDEKLGIQHGRASRELLSRLGVKLTYREYEMNHAITSEELLDADEWLKTLLPTLLMA